MNERDFISKVGEIVSDFQSNLARLQLRQLWKEKTGTDDPREWSTRYRTPILACVPTGKWDDFKRSFTVPVSITPQKVRLNSPWNF